MIFFFKSDGTLIKSAPETVYQGSAEAGKVYVVAPLNAGMLVDVYYELPNGERWGAYLLENNGTVINNEELPDGWALWSTTLESAITQYAGTLKAQFGFYQSGTADKVPLITSQGVTITIAKGIVRDLQSAPTADVYAQIVNAISSIKQDIANLPNEYLGNTQEDKIALKNNGAVEYSENATAGTIAKRDSDGKINVAEGTEDLNAVNVGQFNAALNDLDNVYVRRYKAPVISERRAYVVTPSGHDETVPIHINALGDDLPIRTATGQLKAADGVADDDLATVKQLNAVQVNYTDITNIDLNTGDTTVEYDTELGITVNAKGTLTHKNGATEQPTTKFEVPIIAGAGVSIDKKEAEEKVEIKSLNSNLENGTGEVLIQTNDTNHSFKVMKDGRAKVQSAPTEADDVVRKKELDSALTSVYTYKGSKDTYANLPATGNNVGDVWNVEDTGNNYAWNGTNWDSLSANVLDSTGNSTVQAMSQKATTEELNKKVNISDNFVKVFTIPNGASSGTLTADVKQKLCNPDGHNYYVFDDTSEMILKYSFNSDDEIIQYKAAYLQNDKAYEITMQILPSNGSWRRSQTILNGATANPTLTGTEAELTGLKVGGTNYKIPANEGWNTLTNVDLTVGNTTVQYNTTDGIQLNSTARFTDAEGNHDATMELDLPIIAGDNVTIDKSATGEQIVIKASSGGLATIKAGDVQFSEVFNYDPKHVNVASGKYSHAEGCSTYASKESAHAEGENTSASGYYSHAEGYYCYATNEGSHAEGSYNINPMPANLIHATGIGTTSERRDGFEVYKTGEVWCKGPLYVGGVDDTGKDIYQLDRTKAKEVATKEYVNSKAGGTVYIHNIRLNAQFTDNDNASGDFLFSFTSSRQTEYKLQDLTTIFNAFGSNIITTATIRKQETGLMPNYGIANVLYSEGADVLEIRAFITDGNTVTGYYKTGSLSDVTSLQDAVTEL